MLLHTQQAPLKDGFLMKYNTELEMIINKIIHHRFISMYFFSSGKRSQGKYILTLILT